MVLARATAFALALATVAGWSQSGQPEAGRAQSGQPAAGRAAFERQDYAAAAALWRVEAAEGSADAKFGLGLLHDLGLGGPRNSPAALRWYLEAAGDGLAEAQFNVAVMLDAGTGVPSEPAAAASWYARAAANGHARAQYNLGLLYEDGIGVPRDPAIARAWFAAASPVLAAAADRLARLPKPAAQAPGGPPPRPVTGAIVGPKAAPRAELVWTADGGSGAFEVQIAAARGTTTPGEGDLMLSRRVDRSAIALALPAGAADLIWRVGRAGVSTPPAWSAWRDLSRQDAPDEPPDEPPGAPPGAPPDEPPKAVAASAMPAEARLTILINAGDRLARAFAEELSEGFAAGGVVVTVRRAKRNASATAVSYRDPADAGLAAAVAAFVPVLRAGSAIRDPNLGTPAGEVTLRLVGGPGPLGG